MWISWRVLEGQIELNELPSFHRAFLRWRGVEGSDDMPLRRVQQRVEAELNRLVQIGQARRESGDWEIHAEALAGFDAAAPYL
ncbi:hypothetical protein [Deinococcus peraridilitoris]|uniref:Uncharacterized protein n=1 Tax=Deinococcus peraridilitoris (strain DSM 19664 / LMG 22246 / CIP 109416 / KR-200) TaxID=937777 RepID=L0A1Q0_DEIPD|nr:hypothetical protein [Deinococcus peraridilitoris]AFZ67379.1 hypothetical protein Deipe_1863 [Deinococcus peraridilitoris DSM 19664]